jgi:hypothetical protein
MSRRWLAGVALAIALAVPATASRLIPRTLPELMTGADRVFVGRCESAFPHWNADHTLILTTYRFRVSRVLKGKLGETAIVEELGGAVGGVGLEVTGVPRYTVGEEALLFVRRTPLGRWETFGALQGKFRVVRDAQGRPRVQSDFYRAELAGMAAPDRSGDGAPLDTFASRLQTMAPAERLR